MEFTNETRKRLTRWILGIITTCILIYLAVQNLGIIASAIKAVFKLFLPLILGGVIALVINVPMQYFEKRLWPTANKNFAKKIRRPVAYLISVVLICGAFAGIVYLVIPEFIAAVTMIVKGTIDFINKISEMNASELAELPFGDYLVSLDWNSLLDTMQNWLKNQGSNIIHTVVGSVSTIVSDVYSFLMAFFFSIYLLFGKEMLSAQVVRLLRVWMPRHTPDWLIHATLVLGKNFRNFISAQTIEAIILGVLCMVGMWILRIPYAPMVGTLVGVTALIPVVGAFIGTIVGAFMILTVSPVKALVFVIFLLILQQLEGNLIYPRVMGSKVNLPSIWILAAVTVGGSLSGAMGMLVAVPIVSTVYILLREATEKREKMISEKQAREAVYEEIDLSPENQEGEA